MSREPSPQELDNLAAMLSDIADDLGDDITMEDMKRHAWLRKVLLASDRIVNAVRYDAYVWTKEQGD